MRDDFPKSVKAKLAKRVGYRCSNPECRQGTSGPSLSTTETVNMGVAAHITAASPGGARYDPTLTPEQRKSYDNGIWLCKYCADLVDKDEVTYPVELLRTWNTLAERRAAMELHRVPALPPDSTDKIEQQLLPDPIVKCSLQYPINIIESIPRINKENPDIILYNDGAVSVVALKVDLWFLGFDKRTGKIVTGGRWGQSPHMHLFAIDKFDPSATESKSVNGVHGSEVIGIYIADLAFNREVDWKEYKSRYIFLLENDFIYTEEGFSHRDEYESMVNEIDKFIADSTAQPGTWLRAVDQGWIVDLNPEHRAIFHEDGSFRIIRKFYDIEKLKSFWTSKRRPFLTIKPAKFKTTNSFLEYKIEGGKNIVRVQFEVSNDSSETAFNVVQEAEESASPWSERVSIPPGHRKFIVQTIVAEPVSSKASAVPCTPAPCLELDTLGLVVKNKAILYSGTESDKNEYRTAISCELKKESAEVLFAEFE